MCAHRTVRLECRIPTARAALRSFLQPIHLPVQLPLRRCVYCMFSASMKIDEHQWTCMEFIEIDDDQWKRMKINEHPWKLWRIINADERLCQSTKSMEIHSNLSKSANIHPSPFQFTNILPNHSKMNSNPSKWTKIQTKANLLSQSLMLCIANKITFKNELC